MNKKIDFFPPKEGSFTISLDFELLWGVHANRSIESYETNLLGVYEAIPKMLKLFEKYEVHVTWATVGFLFHKNIDDIKRNKPKILPDYMNDKVNPYSYIDRLHSDKEYGKDFTQMHCASSLIEQITETPFQELASHTYSHFFTYEPCLNKGAFRSDMEHALSITSKKGFKLNSLVFPRNQINQESIKVLEEMKISSYRGNPKHWAYSEGDTLKKSFFLRVYRLLDTYINLSGHHTSKPIFNKKITELRASMMLRPYFYKLKFLEKLKLRRIKKAMLYAGKKGENFHLWWHPHNFGKNQDENLKNLEILLAYYQKLHFQYKLKSLTMNEVLHHVNH